MRGMILAAGRGQRMRELTTNTPKPLLRVGNRYLIEYSLLALANVGVKDIVINICYFAEKIKQALGDGSRYGVNIHYSEEKEALETGGGIYQALPLLGSGPFIVLSCDVIADYALNHLPSQPDGLAHLVLVDNPIYHPKGDFCLEGKRIFCGSQPTFTFSNMGIYRPELFANCSPGRFRLGNLLQEAISQNKVTGEHFSGAWFNLGSPEDIALFEKCSVGTAKSTPLPTLHI
jgi:MurNAc alpha-1-phosphate uridylyltransferase